MEWSLLTQLAMSVWTQYTTFLTLFPFPSGWWAWHLFTVFIPQREWYQLSLHTSKGKWGESGVHWGHSRWCQVACQHNPYCHWPFLKTFFDGSPLFYQACGQLPWTAYRESHIPSELLGCRQVEMGSPANWIMEVELWLNVGYKQWFPNTDFPWPHVNIRNMLCGHIICNIIFLHVKTINKIINLKFKAKHKENVMALIYSSLLNRKILTGCFSTANGQFVAVPAFEKLQWRIAAV